MNVIEEWSFILPILRCSHPGGTPCIIEKAKLPSEENELLKRNESLFMPDSFAWRRKVSATPRQLAMVMRAFLEQFGDGQDLSRGIMLNLILWQGICCHRTSISPKSAVLLKWTISRRILRQ
jgi:hypothetical protein